MAEHTLPDGQRVISALKVFGEALGYESETEERILGSGSGREANDVTWKYDKHQRYPLFTFEVESTASNTAANNVMKVFASDNTELEKPLFFFHVFVTGSGDSGRITRLERHFGSYNYRVYKLEIDGLTPLVRDVLAQHRRLTSELNVEALVEVLSEEKWRGVDIGAVVRHAEALRFEEGTGTFLPAYGRLSLQHPEFQNEYVRYLRQRTQSPDPPEADQYGIYWGDNWSEPVHIAILGATATNGDADKSLDQLKHWQDKSSYMPRICDYLGRSQDYDHFVADAAPFLWALVGNLMRNIPGATAYIAAQCYKLLKPLEQLRPHLWIPMAIWGLHIAAASADSTLQFEDIRTFANARGGLPRDLLLNPPPIGEGFQEDGNWMAMLQESVEPVPDVTSFLASVGSEPIDPKQRVTTSVSAAITFMTAETPDLQHASLLLQLLHAHAPGPQP